MNPIPLSQIKPGVRARIVSMDQETEVCRRLMNLGVLPTKHIRFVKAAPLGDPLEFEVDGRNFSMRKREAAFIHVEVQEGSHSSEGVS